MTIRQGFCWNAHINITIPFDSYTKTSGNDSLKSIRQLTPHASPSITECASSVWETHTSDYHDNNDLHATTIRRSPWCVTNMLVNRGVSMLRHIIFVRKTRHSRQCQTCADKKNLRGPASDQGGFDKVLSF